MYEEAFPPRKFIKQLDSAAEEAASGRPACGEVIGERIWFAAELVLGETVPLLAPDSEESDEASRGEPWCCCCCCGLGW